MEEALDLSFDRLLMMMMMTIFGEEYRSGKHYTCIVVGYFKSETASLNPGFLGGCVLFCFLSFINKVFAVFCPPPSRQGLGRHTDT